MKQAGKKLIVSARIAIIGVLALLIAYPFTTIDLIFGQGLFFFVALILLVIHFDLFAVERKALRKGKKCNIVYVLILSLIVIGSPTQGYLQNYRHLKQIEQYAQSAPEEVRLLRLLRQDQETRYYLGNRQIEESDVVFQDYLTFKKAGHEKKIRSTWQGDELVIFYRKYGLTGSQVLPYSVATGRLGECCLRDIFWD